MVLQAGSGTRRKIHYLLFAKVQHKLEATWKIQIDTQSRSDACMYTYMYSKDVKTCFVEVLLEQKTY